MSHKKDARRIWVNQMDREHTATWIAMNTNTNTCTILSSISTVLSKCSFIRVPTKGSWIKWTSLQRMTGTQPTQFDGHLAEVTWSPEARGRMFLAFLDLLRLVYTLQGPEYRHITSLSDSWTMEPDAATPIVEWRIMPADSNAESKLSSQSSMRDNVPTEIIRRSDDRYIWLNQCPGCSTVVNSTYHMT